jgi:hypothetical protein
MAEVISEVITGKAGHRLETNASVMKWWRKEDKANNG